MPLFVCGTEYDRAAILPINTAQCIAAGTYREDQESVVYGHRKLKQTIWMAA